MTKLNSRAEQIITVSLVTLTVITVTLVALTIYYSEPSESSMGKSFTDYIDGVKKQHEEEH